MTRMTVAVEIPDGSDLEQMLLFLSKYGKPRLGRLDSGWYCVVDFFATGKGVDFKIGSEFGHQFPRTATHECITRLQETLSSLKQIDP